jgi:hypothetical protein
MNQCRACRQSLLPAFIGRWTMPFILLLGIWGGSIHAAQSSFDVSIAVTITPGPPAVDLNGVAGGIDANATFAKGGGPVSIVDASGLTVNNYYDSILTGATAIVTNRVDGANELLAVTASGGVSASYDTSTGVLTLSGAASTASYQTVLRTLTYDNTATNPNSVARIISVTVNDSVLISPTATSTITMVANNAPASVDLNGGAEGTGYLATFTVGGPAVAIVDPTGLIVTDPDQLTVDGATVTITNLLDGVDELLSVTVSGAVTANYNSSTGVLTLSGVDTLARYETVLRTLTYANTAQEPNATARTITVAVNDGFGLGTPAVAMVKMLVKVSHQSAGRCGLGSGFAVFVLLLISALMWFKRGQSGTKQYRRVGR